MDGLPDFRRPALARAVIHHGHARRDGVHELRRARHVHAVVRNHVDVHRADLVLRAHQVVLLVPGEVAQVEQAEIAVPHQHPDGAGVFGGIDVVLLKAGALRIGLAGAGERHADQVAVGGKHRHVQTLDGNGVAGFRQDVLALVALVDVGVVENIGIFAVLVIGAVVHEVHDRELFGELGHSAHVVGVVVGDHQVIDLLHARGLGRRGDAIGIAVVVPRPAGIDQHGFTGGRDQQRGLASFDVDEVDFQVPGGRQQGGRAQQYEGGNEGFHAENRITARTATLQEHALLE